MIWSPTSCGCRRSGTRAEPALHFLRPSRRMRCVTTHRRISTSSTNSSSGIASSPSHTTSAPGDLQTQTHLTVLAFPEVRDFASLGILNHGMLLMFYVDDHRLEIDLAGVLDDTRAHPVVHEFTEQIRTALPRAYDGFMDGFREFCAANLLQGKLTSSKLLYSRIKSKTMGIVPVHYLLWSLRGLAPEKFGALKLHDYLYRLELDTLMVNDRHSLQKEADSSEWNGMAVHRFTDDEQGAVIDENYAHLIATLGELLATEDDPSCVEVYGNFKICADATKAWEEFSPRYHSDHSDTETAERTDGSCIGSGHA